MTTFFSADQHWHHANILKLCQRPFESIGQMDEALVAAWNARVGPTDVVYHLGDLTMGDAAAAMQLIARLNGQLCVVATPWHHDKRWLKAARDEWWYTVGGQKVTYLPPLWFGWFEDTPITLSHYALEVWERSHYQAVHLHGHSHGRLRTIPNRLDVGVDATVRPDYKGVTPWAPISLQEAIRLIRQMP
jgi:calcineurin-like phosphoesterase family protein